MQVGLNTDYLQRQPERLVIEGYRRWTTGFVTGSIVPWEMARELYSEILGEQDAGLALNNLSQYVRTLRRCATCPLRSFPHNSSHMCMEECLTIGLIAGLQHEDDTAAICLHHIACQQMCDEVKNAALEFANTLRDFGQVLLPVPTLVVNDILNRSKETSFH
ncbi:MAG: hypothetical protein AAF478_10470 [Pseudomonadota bacterium]